MTRNRRIFALMCAVEIAEVDRDKAMSGREEAQRVIDDLKIMLAEARALPEDERGA